MIKPRHNLLHVPVELSRFAIDNGLVTPFSVFLYLKFCSDGKLRGDAPELQQMRKDLHLRDLRTFNKHLNKLKELNWIGFNPSTNYYFIRSFDQLREMHLLKKRRASELRFSHVKNLQVYLTGVILCTEVMGQKYWWELKNRRKWRTAMKKSDVANQSKVFSEIPEYYGLSNESLGRLLGCKKTWASNLKNAAVKAGFIKKKQKLVPYVKLSGPDYQFRPIVNEMFPDLKGKFRVVRKSVKNVSEYWVMVQFHDEIIPQMKFKTVSKFTNLRLPKGKVMLAKLNKIKK